MSYDLRIMFSGLAMYVPQEKKGIMHVLLPMVGSHEHPAGAEDGHAGHGGGVHGHQDDGGTALLDPPTETAEAETPVPAVGNAPAGATGEEIEPHFTRVIYDAAYEDPTATQLSRKYIVRDFERRSLDLSSLTTAEPFDPRLPDEIPPIDAIAGTVDPVLVADGDLDTRLAGRVVLRAGAFTGCLLGARFNLGGEDRRITVRSEWTVRGVATEEKAPDGSTRAVLPAQEDGGLPKPLYPIGQTIHLMVFNTTAEEFPPHGPGFVVRRPRSDAHHFGVYFALTMGKGSEIPKRIDRRQVEVEVVGPPVAKRRPQAILGMTCVQSRGSVPQ